MSKVLIIRYLFQIFIIVNTVDSKKQKGINLVRILETVNREYLKYIGKA